MTPADNAIRTPPHNIQAEACVLGSMMLDAGAIPIVREIVRDVDFFRPAHQVIFRGLCWMQDHEGAVGKVDLVTFREQLTKRKQLEAIGGIDYLVALVEGLPDAGNAAYYAKIIRDAALARGAILAGEALRKGGMDNDDLDALAAMASDAAESLARGSDTRHLDASVGVSANVEAAISGRRVSILWPWREVTRHARPCAPGCVTLICGAPSSGKTFWFQEACLAWHRQGVPLAVLHLEKDRTYHLGRVLAQLGGNGSLAHDEWQQGHPEEARSAMEAHRAQIQDYGRSLYDSPGVMTLDAVLQWLRARVSEGARIVGVDPITAADAGRERWGKDAEFMLACGRLAMKAGASVVLVTHPPKGTGKEAPSGDNLAGGAAYFRNSDVVLWLQGHNPPIENDVQTPCGPATWDHNRTVTFCKTRDGTGVGLSVALNFDPATLQTSEVGVIQKKKKGG